MKDIHPSPTAKGGRAIPDEIGEEEYYYCRQCGFPNKVGRTKVGGKGDGISIVNNEPEVKSGCSFCGTFNSR